MRNALAPNQVAIAFAMAVFTCLSSSTFAQAPAAPAPGLDRLMGQINRSYRQVKAQVSDKTQNAKTLEALATMETAAITAKGLVPPSVAKLPEAQRPAKLAEYRKQMGNLIIAMVQMEQNLLADDNTKAAEMVAKLDEIEKQGHAAFRPEE